MTWKEMQDLPINQSALRLMQQHGISPSGDLPYLLELASEALDAGRGDPSVENDLLRLYAMEPEQFPPMFARMGDWAKDPEDAQEEAEILWENGPSDSVDAMVQMVRKSGLPDELFTI